MPLTVLLCQIVTVRSLLSIGSVPIAGRLPPKSRSYPVATGDPFAEAQAHQSVDEANTNAQAQYQQQLHRLHTHLAKVRAAVHQQTQRLRSLTWPIDAIQTDVFGCVERAS